MNEWGEAARSAGLVVAYSEGKRPAPRISVAALLPQGVTGDNEIMDVYLEERIDPREALKRLASLLPEGVTLVDIEEVGPATPSVQQQLRWAEYEVEIPASEVSADELREVIERLLESRAWPAEYRREKKVKEYDLRPLVIDISLDGERDGSLALRMALKAEQESSARADQVLQALGLPEARRIHRLALHLARMPEVVLAYREGEGR